MSEQFYNWKRFWCPREGNINLADRGYLYDPDSEYGRYYNISCVPFESIEEIPCLVLLGEPGIGKTTAMKSQKALIEQRVVGTGGASLWVNLNAFQTDIMLCQSIFENPTFNSWLCGNYQLHLFLDSLDECLLRINAVAALLAEELKKYPVDRLCLRIACRTAEWPNGLEKDLIHLWGNENVKAYELAPLRRKDVIEAALANKLKHEEFLQEIERMDVVPFAIKPVTLQMLINIFRIKGQFPSIQADLYYQGCKILCEETSESRRDAKFTGAYNAEQRIIVAGRIAAVTVFAGKYAVWTGIDRGDVPEGDITVSELCGENEVVKSNYFEVNDEAIRETLATGLFSSRGPNRLGWAHQSYAEFLASWYLVQHNLDLVQIMSLIAHPGDPEGKIVPQLHEAAAWLATMNPEVFREIMQTDPDLLLRSDVATADAKDKEALVENLLKLFDEEKLIDFDLDLRRRYGKLWHLSLAEQLRPYINDSGKGFIVRRVAIDIAEDCRIKDLQDDLINIALDTLQHLSVRINAAHAIYKLGNEETKAKLKPLATVDAGDDPDDELKGCSLLSVWPTHMTAEEFFFILTPPKRRNLLGIYKMFIRTDIAKHIQPSDLPYALAWVEKQKTGHGFSSTFEDLKDEIILVAWDYLERAEVLKGFARVVLSRIKNHHGFIREKSKLEKFKKGLNGDDKKRRKILETVIPILEDPKRDSFWLVDFEPPFVFSKDIPWMIERLQAVRSEKEQLAWAYLIDRVLDIRDSQLTEAIYKAIKKNVILYRLFAPQFKTVGLESLKAKKSREDYYKMKEWQERHQERPLLEPPPTERIEILLNKFDAGDLAAWWQINKEMTLEPDSTHYGDELESDLTKLTGWKSADAKRRIKIIEAAKEYILKQDPNTSKWLGTKILHRPAFAGYRALILIMKEDPDFMYSLPNAIWKEWAPIIIAYPVSSGFEEDESLHQKLLNTAYQYAPDEIIKSLLVMIDKENEEHDHIFITRKVLGCWDKRISDALLVKGMDAELKPKCMGCLLSDLLDHENDEAKEYAQSLITLPIQKTEKDRQRAIVAARVLMCHARDAGWPVVWTAIQQDLEYGCEVLSDVAQEDRHSASVGCKLKEEQLADLFLWIVQQFPYSKDPIHDDAHWAGLSENVAEWRNSILSQLKNRGTYEARDAIQRIAQELPELEWLKWTLLDAGANARRHTWLPQRPDVILKIATNKQFRLVNSGDQLLDVLTESLKRYQEKLQGETPAVIDLWNEKPYIPKDENRFSDHVKRHLEDDLRSRGIIVNREVVIRRGVGDGTGEQTDIHVDAVVRVPKGEVYDIVTVIIEVKGCWHNELESAMKTQLTDRYLKDNRCQQGLYLIGWFNCNRWDSNDSRKVKAPKISINEAKANFDDQAQKLSQEGKKIKALVLNTALR